MGSHSDDIEIGCGGTILRLAEQYPGCVFHWVVFSAVGVREAEARRSASLFAGPALKGPLLKAFPDGFMPFVGAEVKAVFEELKKTVSPDLIFTHNRKDAHQDHRLSRGIDLEHFSQSFDSGVRDPKYDGDMGQPNFFVPLEPHIYERKVRYIMDSSSRNTPSIGLNGRHSCP